jgi:hypothetical protein
MPRRYQPQRRGYYPDADEYSERESRGKKTPAWQTWAKYIGIGIFILLALLFILSATGNLKGSTKTTIDGNQTIEEEPSEYEQMTTYIISQQQQGLNREEITQRLELAGYTTEEIETAFQLSDPITQEILKMQKEGRARQEIVEILLDRGITPEEIQNRFAIIESTQKKGLDLKGNLIWIIIGGAVIFFIIRTVNNDSEEKKYMPKVYTLDECEEYAREYLDNKQKTYNPSKQYRNRPDLRQYRFVYEETLYPEFNDHLPTGHKIGKRLYYLICVGYDREVIDYQETYDDNKIAAFLYGAPKGFEASGSKEYMTLRGTSEKEIEETKKPSTSLDDDDRDYYRRNTPYRRRNTPYVRPGPVGFEER